MSNAADIHVILSCKTGYPASGVLQQASMMAKSGLCSKLSLVNCGHVKNEIERECASLLKQGLAVEFSDSSNFLEAASCSGNSEYIFFLSSNISFNSDALSKMHEKLMASPHLAGLNPLFIHDDYVAHMGTVADSQGFIHYLYEGLHKDNALASKERTFQLANPDAFLLRRRDFINSGEINKNVYELAFFDLCIRIVFQTGLPFATSPDARVIIDDKYSSWNQCGLWNSLLIREKLPPKLLKPDYALHVQADGMEYGISEWLQEGALNVPENNSGDFWLEWRRSNDPMKFLFWLKNLDSSGLAWAVQTAWDIPATFPNNFMFYKTQAEKKLAFAKDNNLYKMTEQLHSWLSRAQNFRHEYLKPAMMAFHKAGLYECPLDYLPAIYDAWLEISPANQFQHMEIAASWPQIAVVTPVWNPPLDFFKQTIESVLSQTYGNWQFCLADDCSTKPGIRELLNCYAKEDKRIKVVFRNENGHISRATNSALELVDAPFSAFLDHDDLLTRDALAQTAKALVENPDLKFVYSDEDHIDIDNVPRSPFFRPAFDRFLHSSGHLSCMETSLIRETGCLRPVMDGCQDYDLSKRIMESINERQVGHIARILYHWRVHAESTSAWIGAKPYVLEATKKMFVDAAKRRGFEADVIYGKRNYFRTVYDVRHVPVFSIIILDDCGALHDSLVKCLEKQKAEYNAHIYWQPLDPHIKIPSNMAGISESLSFSGSHWTRGILNAAKSTNSDVLLFVSSRLAPRPDCRPEQMAILAAMPHVAAVGGNIHHNECLWHGGLYPDATGLPFPLLSGVHDYLMTSYCWGQMIRVRQVIGLPWQCMAIKRLTLLEEKIFDLKMGSLINADFSMSQEEKDEYTAICPWGEWDFIAQPTMQKSTELEKINFLKKWKSKVQNHVLRNPNLKATNDNDWTIIF